MAMGRIIPSEEGGQRKTSAACSLSNSGGKRELTTVFGLSPWRIE
jgi:hypothetical protein